MAYGPGESRFVEEKRHFEKPIPISDLVFLDRERCILCDRCTRFASEVAGDPLISFTGPRQRDAGATPSPMHPFASYFSGNTVQICPVGALTAKPYRFKARPWDLEQEESTCTTCSVGCRVTVAVVAQPGAPLPGRRHRPGELGLALRQGPVRVRVDRERPALVSAARARATTELVEASWPAALERAATAIREALTAGGPESVAVIGGARLTNEDAYAWAKLAKGGHRHRQRRRAAR